MNYRQIEVTSHGDVVAVKMLTRKLLDAAAIQEFGEELANLVFVHERHDLVFDWSLVEFISSAGLNKLVNVGKCLKPMNKPFIHFGVRPEIIDVLQKTRLDRERDDGTGCRFVLFGTLEEALGASLAAAS